MRPKKDNLNLKLLLRKKEKTSLSYFTFLYHSSQEDCKAYLSGDIKQGKTREERDIQRTCKQHIKAKKKNDFFLTEHRHLLQLQFRWNS